MTDIMAMSNKYDWLPHEEGACTHCEPTQVKTNTEWRTTIVYYYVKLFYTICAPWFN